jgi:hypothetical protein
MLAPLLFLPLASPLTLAIALPVVAEHFLSFRSQQHWLLFQYTALVTPVMVVAAVYGLGNLMRLVGRPSATTARSPARGPAHPLALGVAGTALAAALVCHLLYGPVLRRGWVDVPPMPEQNWPSVFDRTQRIYRDRMIARIPADGGVVAAFEFLARLASRRDLHSMHHLYTGYYTFSSEPYPMPTGVTGTLADLGDERLAIYVKPSTPNRLRELVSINDLRPADAAGDLVLFLRAPRDTVELMRIGVAPPPGGRRVVYDRQLELMGAAIPEPGAAAESLLTIETYWRRVGAADRQFVTQLVLSDPAGRAVFSLGRHLGYLLYPVATWPAHTVVRETYRMVIPAHIQPGDYSLGLRVAWWREGKPALSAPDDSSLVASKLIVDLGRVTVTPPGR